MVADRAADMEVHTVAVMEVDKVTDMVVDKKQDWKSVQRCATECWKLKKNANYANDQRDQTDLTTNIPTW